MVRLMTNRKQNASNREDFNQVVKLSLCDCGNAQISDSVQTKEKELPPHWTQPLPIQQMELPCVN